MEEKGLIEFEWEDTEACVGVIADWFGIPRSFFDDYRILRSNTKTLNIVNADIEVERKPRPEAVGMPFLHTNMAVRKLTQPAALFLGPHCRRNIVHLDRTRAVAYMGRGSVDIAEEDMQECDGPGYVMVGYNGMILGLGFRHRERPMVLESFMPKAWAVAPGVDPF